MNRLIASLCVLALLTNLAGCKHEQPTYTVCLLDISKSITSDGIQDEFKAMDSLVDRMQRGDRLTLIPITGNARNDTSGHIVRLKVPSQRMAFDSDLKSFRKQAHGDIARMRDWQVAHPGNRTDILGALQLAQQELDSGQLSTTDLIILSDFLEDDGNWNFAKDHALASAANACLLADITAKRLNVALRSTHLYLGRLRSRDSAALPSSRLDAVDAFWGELLNNVGQPVVIHDDGVGSLLNRK